MKDLSLRYAVNDPTSALGDFKEINGKGNNDYTYDTSGNLKSDVNKNISAITYNHLNLPQSIAITGKGSIVYRYDANGNKLEKIVTDSTGTVPKVITTDYINGFVYKNDTLQFLAHEEGRIRTVLKTGQPVAFNYDYFVKDHLGNIRMVLTEQSDVGVYTATMETGLAPSENALFSNLDNTRIPKPAGYPADATTSPNDYIARLNATNGQKIGPSLVLRVMAGDTLQIGSKAFYKSTAASTPATTTTNMLAALLQAFGGGGVGDGAHSATGPGSPLAVTFNNTAYDNLKQKDPSQNLADKPKSYLNYALFDDQFVMVNENSGVKQVQGTPDVLQTLATDKMVIKKTGFVYIYTSNESAQDVFFDNLVVSHNSGPLLEETHYYPFGLTMAGISSNALKGASYSENRMRYNGKELQIKEFGDGSGLEWYDYGKRMYDQQIGRWHVIDSMSERYYESSPYVYVLNNPIRRIDIKGYTDWDAILKGVATTVGGVVGTVVGGAAIISPTFGVGQVGGAALVSTSIPATGLGIGMVIAGIKDNNSAGNIPGGVFEASGMAVDATMGNRQPVARNVGSVTDLGVSVALGGVPTNARDAVVTTTQAIYTANDIYNMATGSNTSVSTKVGNTVKSVIPQNGTGSGAARNVNTGSNTGRTDQNSAGAKKPETPNFLDPTFKGFLR